MDGWLTKVDIVGFYDTPSRRALHETRDGILIQKVNGREYEFCDCLYYSPLISSHPLFCDEAAIEC